MKPSDRVLALLKVSRQDLTAGEIAAISNTWHWLVNAALWKLEVDGKIITQCYPVAGEGIMRVFRDPTEERLMPAKCEWTEAEDDMVRAACLDIDNAPGFPAIAAQLGINRWTVSNRARALGLPLPPDRLPTPPLREPGVVPQHYVREPLPAGHALTWGVIVAGTCLENMEYPGP